MPFTPVGKLFKMDESSNKWTGTEYNDAASKYDVYGPADLTREVASSDSVIRVDGAPTIYLNDTTNFISADGTGSNLEVKTATGMMSMNNTYVVKEQNKEETKTVQSIVIADDRDALYVIYAGSDLKGATSSSDIVYLDGQPNTQNKDGWEGSIWFMDGLKNEDVTLDNNDAKGFYRFTVNSDGIYELDPSKDVVSVDDNNELKSDTTGIASDVYFTTAKNTVITSGAADDMGYYNTIKFIGVSMSGATVIDTRSSSDMKADVYSNEINSTSKLVTALSKANVAADVYVENGKITFIAVKDVYAKPVND